MGEAREIYLAACDQVAQTLSGEGFVYHASEQTLVNEAGDLTRTIYFQSSPRNFLVPRSNPNRVVKALAAIPVLGELASFGSIALIANAGIQSKAIERWRNSLRQPLAQGDAVVGGQIGNLQLKPKWIEFNLANPYRRDHVISDIVKLVRTVAIPYLHRFSNPAAVISDLLRGKMPWGLEVSALEYTLCFGSAEQAQELLGRLLREYPGHLEQYRERLREYRENGLPEAYDSARPGRLAKATLALSLSPI